MSMHKGTTMIELVLAMGVIITGLLVVLGLIVRSINIGSRTKNDLVAATLAEEAMEAVRIIRDSNALEIESEVLAPAGWNLNLDGCKDGYTAQGVCTTQSRTYFGYPIPQFTPQTTPVVLVESPWRFEFFKASNNPFDYAVLRKGPAEQPPNLLFQQLANDPTRETGYYRMVTLEPLCNDGGITKTLRQINPTLDLINDPDCDGLAPPREKVGIRAVVTVRWRDLTAQRGQGYNELELTQEFYDWR